jgi:CRP/FNR family transcriptional regulator, cyclic AMP receptor protein
MEKSNMWYLENIDAEGIFCPQKLGSPSKTHAHKVFKKGEHIFEPNEASDKLYFISSGRVKIGTDTQGEKSITKAILEPGEIFGEMAMMGESHRRDFAIALEEAHICEISRDAMTSLFMEHNPLYLFMMNLIGSRAQQMEKRLESLVFKDSRSRIIEFLVDLNERKGSRVGYEWVVRRFITHQEIANLTATSRQTVTTILNELKNKNLITFNRKRLLIRDLEKLQSELSIEAV